MQKNWPTRVLAVFVVLYQTASLVVPALLLSPPPVFAQTAGTEINDQESIQSLGIANYIPIEDSTNIPDGSIIAHIDSIYSLTADAYDKNMMGVYDSNPALAFEPQNTDNQVPVITTGTVEVRVNASNGQIKKGDAITSSTTPGVGMKATKSGFILGIAQEDSQATADEPDMIAAQLDVKFAFGADTPESELITNRLLTLVSASTLAAIEEPTVAFRTVLAALLVLMSLLISFLTFARIAQKGIDALGRNPLAGRMITMGIILNICVSILIIASGIAGAYFLITL